MGRRLARSVRRNAVAFGLVLAALPLWQLGAWSGILDPILFSSPADVGRSGVAALSAGRLPGDVAATFTPIAIGMASGLVAGVTLGVVLGLSRRARWLFEWFFVVLNSLPRVALAPLFLLAFGLGVVAKSAVAFLGAVVPITLLVAAGVRETPRELDPVARSLEMSRAAVLFKIVLPSAYPHVFTGLQLGFTRALIAVVVAEMLNPTVGLGRYIAVGMTAVDPAQLLFAGLLVGVIGAVAVRLIGAAQSYVVRWR